MTATETVLRARHDSCITPPDEIWGAHMLRPLKAYNHSLAAPPSNVANPGYCSFCMRSPRANFWRLVKNISVLRRSLPDDVAALCGVTITFGRSHKGECAGN